MPAGQDGESVGSGEKPALRFSEPDVCVREFAGEVGDMAPLVPRLREDGADGAGGLADLVGERVAIFARESLALFEDVPLEPKLRGSRRAA